MLLSIFGAVIVAPLALALGEKRVIYFPTESDKSDPILVGGSQQTVFSSSHHSVDSGFSIASKVDHYVAPFLLDSRDDIAIHLAAQTLARDIHTITGIPPRLYNDTLPSNVSQAIIIGSLGSKLIGGISEGQGEREGIKGRWESYDVRVTKKPLKHLKEGLVVTGSDRVSHQLHVLSLVPC